MHHILTITFISLFCLLQAAIPQNQLLKEDYKDQDYEGKNDVIGVIPGKIQKIDQIDPSFYEDIEAKEVEELPTPPMLYPKFNAKLDSVKTSHLFAKLKGLNRLPVSFDAVEELPSSSEILE
ncbi:unnamed protein product, partial [Mesorhabditis spiculigera]